MKVHIELDMTPEEARAFMGLPDVKPLQEKMMAEMERRVLAAMDTSDPRAMLEAWMPLGGQGFEKFQQFMWDAASSAVGGGAPRKPKSKD